MYASHVRDRPPVHTIMQTTGLLRITNLIWSIGFSPYLPTVFHIQIANSAIRT